jgi:hypothetical protein
MIYAQVPQGLNYQAVASDGTGKPVANATINVRLSILTDTNGFYASGAGTYLWEETHTGVKTNALGLFTIVLGDPLAVKSQGSASTFSTIDWSKGPIYIGSKIQNGTPSFKIMGSAQLWTVPYAMAANNLIGSVSRLKVNGTVTNMDTALFEVKNNFGQTIFAVYNEGVRIYVDDGNAKGLKGGFAIGGFGTKGTSQEYFRVTRDSIRGYINSASKLGKGAFSIGSFGPLQRDIMIVSNTSVSPSVDNLTTLGSITNRWTSVFATSGVVSTSDVRFKTNISEIPYGLESIMKLNPVSYNWKDDPTGKRRLGLIAQDVENVIGEVVETGNDPARIRGINYDEMIPVLIKGIQDQQRMIDSYKTENDLLKSKLQSLEERVEQIQSGLAKSGAK